MKPLFFALAVLVLLTSCIQTKSNLVNKTFEDISRTIIKGTSTKMCILNEFGTPITRDRTADGYERWTYSEQKMISAPSGPAWVKTTLDVVFGKDGTVTVFSFGEIRSYQ